MPIRRPSTVVTSPSIPLSRRKLTESTHYARRQPCSSSATSDPPRQKTKSNLQLSWSDFFSSSIDSSSSSFLNLRMIWEQCALVHRTTMRFLELCVESTVGGCRVVGGTSKLWEIFCLRGGRALKIYSFLKISDVGDSKHWTIFFGLSTMGYLLW